MGTTLEGLIRIPEQPERGGVQGLAAGFVLVTFLMILVGTAAVDVIMPLDQPKLTGGEKRYLQRKRQRARWRNGSMARLFEYEYRISSRVRSTVSKPYADFMYQYLKETGSKILAGDDGWLFLRTRVAMVCGPDSLGARRSAAFHGAVSRRLGSMGIRQLFVPLPRKSVVYRDFLPIGAKVNRAYDAAVVPAMRAQGVETLNLLDLWEANPSPYLFRQTDSHWSTEGMKLTAEAAATFAGFTGPEHKLLGEIRRREGTGIPGDIYRMMSVTPNPSDKEYFSEDILTVDVNGTAVEVHDSDADLVVCGTSFCTKNRFGPFVAHFFGQPVDLIPSPGKPSCVSLLRMLDDRSQRSLPSLVLNELPSFYSIEMGRFAERWTLHEAGGELFSRHAPKKVHALDTPSPLKLNGVELGTPVELRGRLVIAKIEPGAIAHSGGGVVEIAINLDVQVGEASLTVRSGYNNYRVPLVSGSNQVILPVLVAQPGSKKTEVLIMPEGKSATVIVRAAVAVSAIDKKTKTEGVIQTHTVSGEGWQQDVLFPVGTQLRRHSTIILACRADSGELFDLRLEVSDVSGTIQQVFEFALLRKGGLIVVDPGLLYGKELGRVRLSSSSSRPPSSKGVFEFAELFHQ